MASCRVGHVYIVETALARPPKPKFAMCVCVDPAYFVWINTAAPHHGRDQVILQPGCHELVRHQSHLDLSRIIAHPAWELEEAREFECISRAIGEAVVAAVDGGLQVLPPRHASIVKQGMLAIWPAIAGV